MTNSKRKKKMKKKKKKKKRNEQQQTKISVTSPQQPKLQKKSVTCQFNTREEASPARIEPSTYLPHFLFSAGNLSSLAVAPFGFVDLVCRMS